MNKPISHLFFLRSCFYSVNSGNICTNLSIYPKTFLCVITKVVNQAVVVRCCVSEEFNSPKISSINRWLFSSPIIHITQVYDIDIKDTNSDRKARELKDICCHSMYDFSQKVIRRLQPIRSDEVQIMQMVDVIIGAIGYENRIFPEGFARSSAKQEIIDLIKERSGYTLKKTTLLREEKINLLSWEAGGIV